MNLEDTYQEDSLKDKKLSDCTFLETVERMAATNYSYKEIAIYTRIDYRDFLKKAQTEDSDVWLAIQRGRLDAEFEIIDKQSNNARSGSITAAQIFFRNKEFKDFENLKDFIYGE